jgi:hypothetical protein
MSNSEHCVSLDYLAGWMGINAVKQNDGNTFCLRQGKKSLVLDSGSVVATDGNGVRLLPTCPIKRDGTFFVPTKAVIGAFGGNAVDTSDGLRLEYDGKTVVLPNASETPAASGMDRIGHDIDDPRIPLPELAKASEKTSRIWTYLNDFNHSAARVQPTLKAISGSGTLSFLGRVPVVGSAVSVTQYTAQCLDASIQASRFLAKTHQETAEPVRKAVLATDLVRKSPSVQNVRSAIPIWIAAQAAIDKQLAQSDKAIDSGQRMLKSVKSLDENLRQHLGSKVASGDTAAIRVFSRETDQYILRLQGSKWELSALKSYFRILADDSGRIGG